MQHDAPLGSRLQCPPFISYRANLNYNDIKPHIPLLISVQCGSEHKIGDRNMYNSTQTCQCGATDHSYRRMRKGTPIPSSPTIRGRGKIPLPTSTRVSGPSRISNT